MNIRSFIKDRSLSIALLLFAIVTSEIFLIPYSIATFIKIYIPVIIIAMYIVGLAVEYGAKRRYYANLERTLEELDDKYLITEIIQSPNFTEGKILKSTIEEIDKSMVEHVNYYKFLRRGL